MGNARIAMVKATGDKYLVQQIDFRTGTVHCWGELVAYKGLATKHGASVKFSKDDVVVGEVVKDRALVAALFTQAKRIADAKHGPVRPPSGLLPAALKEFQELPGFAELFPEAAAMHNAWVDAHPDAAREIGLKRY